MWKSVALVAGLGGMIRAILAVAGRKLAGTYPIPVSKRSPSAAQAPTAASCGYPAAADWLKPVVAGRVRVSPCLGLLA